MKLKEPMYPPEMMEFFWSYAKHPDFNARCSILRSGSPVPAEILAYLANDKEWYIRMLVALNQRTPIEVLKHLIIDDNSQVRMGVFQNPNCNEEIRLLYFANRKYGRLMNRHNRAIISSTYPAIIH
jgi:hypothetical protein